MRRWCSEDAPKLLKTLTGSIERLELSKNELTDRGVDYLVRFLKENRQAVVRLYLFMNKLTELDSVCDLIEDSELGPGAPGGLTELHLSSNSITLDAFKRLMTSFRRRARDCRGFRQPIWLRLERNRGLEDHTPNHGDDGHDRGSREIADMVEDFWNTGLKVCFDGGSGESGCSVRKCRHNADVHLHLYGANQKNIRKGGKGSTRKSR